ncbi:BMC domain-containing protein [bacterium]|nr:BMC domain-containing protein [bacterium]
MESIGLIEVKGLTAGLTAADAACKAASVRLIGYELAKGGGGMLVIKLAGDVAAVQAAVEAGVAEAKKVGEVVSFHIIPRPVESLVFLIESRETVGSERQKFLEIE